jgi:hypothetical protein
LDQHNVTQLIQFYIIIKELLLLLLLLDGERQSRVQIIGRLQMMLQMMDAKVSSVTTPDG